jgi:TRAP-type C4-dicarboxylate transport system permease small subunit
MFGKIAERISTLANYVGMSCIFVLMILGIVGIVARFAGAPLSGILSLSVFMLVGSVYLSMAYAQLRKSHVAVEFLVTKLHTTPRLFLRTISTLLTAVACLILVRACWPYAWASWRADECMHGEPFYPIYPSKLSVAVGVSILLIQVIADIAKAVRSLRVKSEHSKNSKRDV